MQPKNVCSHGLSAMPVLRYCELPSCFAVRMYGMCPYIVQIPNCSMNKSARLCLYQELRFDSFDLSDMKPKLKSNSLNCMNHQ